MLGVKALVVEKNERIGDNWRGRYEALCLHDVICESSRSRLGSAYADCLLGFLHFPYLPYVSTLRA